MFAGLDGVGRPSETIQTGKCKYLHCRITTSQQPGEICLIHIRICDGKTFP